MMKAALPAFAMLGMVIAVIMIFVAIPWMTEKIDHARRKRQVIQDARRSRQMERWLAARPTGDDRDRALQQVADAYADRRLSLVEHEQRVAVIETAATNRAIEDALKDLHVVERPK
jgi:hypothetical protein